MCSSYHKESHQARDDGAWTGWYGGDREKQTDMGYMVGSGANRTCHWVGVSTQWGEQKREEF